MSDDEERDLRALWLSRLMFGWMVGMPENRSYEEWLAEVVLRERAVKGAPA